MLGNPLQIPQTGGVHEERSLWVETPFHKVFCKQPEDCKQTLKDIVYSSCYIKKKIGTKIGFCLAEYDRDWLRKPACINPTEEETRAVSLNAPFTSPVFASRNLKAPSKTEDASD